MPSPRSDAGASTTTSSSGELVVPLPESQLPEMEKKPKLLQLPDDVESDILSRLPIKSLMRFRCVSKPWNALISLHSFQLLHFHRHSPHIPFPLTTKTFSNSNSIQINHFSTQLPPPLIRSGNVTPINSCLGLVCLVNSVKDRVFICNPSTREILSLPPIGGASHFVAFCYASTSNRFKVVNFFEELSCGRKSRTKCRVFTLGTAKWREISCPLPHIEYNFPEDELLLHDTIHFLPVNDHGDVSIHCFDIKTEEFREIPLPDELVEGSSLWEARYLMELGGFLAVNFNYGDKLDIWLLRDYNEEEWVKEYTIDLTDIVAIIPVAILADESLLLSVEYESHPGPWVLRRYDPVLRKFGNPSLRDGEFGNRLQKDGRWGMEYVESCFSPSPRLM